MQTDSVTQHNAQAFSIFSSTCVSNVMRRKQAGPFRTDNVQ